MNQAGNKSSLPFYILMISAMVAWGGAWVSAKVVAGSCKPQVLIFWRYVITAISMAPFILIRKESFKLDRSSFTSIFLSALALISYSVFFFLGLEKGLAGAGGVLLTTINPLITYALSLVFVKRNFAFKEILGLLIGVLGGVFLLQLWQFSYNELFDSGNLFFLIGALMWSLLAMASQKAQQSCSVFQYSFYLNLLASLMVLFFTKREEVLLPFQLSTKFWLNMAYLSLIGTTFGTTAYFYSTQKLGAAKASSFIFLVPVNAVILSFLILGEVTHWYTIVGGILATTSVYLIHKS